MTTATIKNEAEQFLQRVQTEYPTLIQDETFMTVVVQEMHRLGVYREDARCANFYAAFLSARSAGLIRTPEEIAASAPKSALQLEMERLSAPFSQAQLQTFSALYKQQRFVQGDTDEAWQNKIILLGELRGREISALTFGQAASRIANNSRYSLHFQPEATTEQPEYVNGRLNHAVGGDRFRGSIQTAEETARSTEQPEYVNGKRNHSLNPRLKSEPAKPSVSADTQRWIDLSNALRGNTHAITAEIQQIHGQSPRETYELRIRKLRQYEGR